MKIGFVGYGGFGRALGRLLAEVGCEVRAFDPHQPPPSGVGVGSLAELAAAAELVCLATPVAALAEALAGLGPHLGPAHVVFDVGSVKERPVALLREALGGRVGWVGTHPLFGPVSLARGEHPRTVVITAAPEHPAAAEAVRRLYRSIGCDLVESTPAAHDRRMAETHAIAFFVAKGVLDAGLSVDVRDAPASFQAIARAVEAVRGDAGHLFATIQLDNPYAADVRRTFLDALRGAHERLLSARAPGPERDRELEIPDAGARSEELQATRDRIDEVDLEILGLLQRRAELAERARLAKAELGAGVWDPARETRLLDDRRGRARALGLEPDAVEEVFRAILRFSRRHQQPG